MSRLFLMGGAATLALASGAFGAGIERTAPSTGILFEEGSYIEFGFSAVHPDLSGKGGLLDPTGSGTGDIFRRYTTLSFGYKADINADWSYAVTLGNPYGVDTLYPTVATSGYSGTSATLDGIELTTVLAYDVTPNIKAYGGLRFQQIDAEAFFPFFGALAALGPGVSYNVKADQDWGMGWMVGAAYSRPDIALRVALTYYSEIEHDLATTETITGFPVQNTTTTITTPESLNLEFQTGVAEDTLLFGSVRWVNWSEFTIAPPVFTTNVGQPLVAYQEDWVTYTLGIGRRFNENWAGAFQVSHEPAADYTPLTTLGPVDGRTSYGIAATYTRDNYKVTAGVSYVTLGETSNFATTEFDGGDAVGFGVRFGYSF